MICPVLCPVLFQNGMIGFACCFSRCFVVIAVFQEFCPGSGKLLVIFLFQLFIFIASFEEDFFTAELVLKITPEDFAVGGGMGLAAEIAECLIRIDLIFAGFPAVNAL